MLTAHETARLVELMTAPESETLADRVARISAANGENMKTPLGICTVHNKPLDAKGNCPAGRKPFEQDMTSVAVRDGRNVYQFTCSRCGHECEVGIPLEHKALIACPENCGALYLQVRGSGFFGKPKLATVRGDNL